MAILVASFQKTLDVAGIRCLNEKDLKVYATKSLKTINSLDTLRRVEVNEAQSDFVAANVASVIQGENYFVLH